MGLFEMNQELFNVDYGKEVEPPLQQSYVMSADEGTVRVERLPGKSVCRRYYRRVVPGEKTFYLTEESIY